MGGKAFLEGICKNYNQYILIMDRAFFPYGSKEPDFLFKRAIYLCWYLTKMKVDIIILACNTLSVICLPKIKKYFNVKIMGVIELFDFEKYNNSLFIGTSNTIDRLIVKYPHIDYFKTPRLIEYIEYNNTQLIEKYIKKNRNLFDSYKHIILGCTHFIKIKKYFNNYISQDELFNIKVQKSISDT